MGVTIANAEILRIANLPDGCEKGVRFEDGMTLRHGIVEGFTPYHRLMHMVNAWELLFRLNRSRDVPLPSIQIQDAPHYDFVISPYSVSGASPQVKQWPFDRWDPVVKWMKERGSVVVLGSATDPEVIDAPMLRGEPLDVVAGVVKNAGTVVTMDNGISHLARAVGANHVLMYPAILPLCWVNNPDALTLQGVPERIGIQEFLSAIQAKSKA